MDFLLGHPCAIKRDLLHLELVFNRLLIFFKTNWKYWSFLLAHLSTIKTNLVHHEPLLNILMSLPNYIIS
jgi:hypothetical protein